MSKLEIALKALEADEMEKQVAKNLPAHVSIDKFMRVARTAIQMNPALAEADQRTLFSSVHRAASMGLMPDGREGAIVLFGNQAQFMPMLGGILKMIRNSGELASIDAQIVHKGDSFEYEPAVDPVPKHKPDWFGERGEPVGAYAVARMKDGATYVEVMNKAQLEKVRQVSRSRDKGPWASWWEEMARKTVIRRLAKRLPLSTDLPMALQDESEGYADTPDAPPVEPAQQRPRRSSRINGVIHPIDDDGVIEGHITETVDPPPVDESPV